MTSEAPKVIKNKPDLSYDVHLWDGFDAVKEESKEGLRHTKEMRKFFHRRAQIEEEYARNLMQLCRTVDNPGGSGTLGEAWKTQLRQTQTVASVHSEYANHLKTEVVAVLSDFYTGAKQQREAVVTDGMRQIKMLQESRDHAAKARHQYEKAFKDLNDAKAAGKSLSKKQASLEEKTMEYRNSVHNTNHFQQKFLDEQMPDILRLLQQIDMRRIDTAHRTLLASLDGHRSVPNAQFASDKHVRQSVDEISIGDDIDAFIRSHVTTNNKPESLQFVEYGSTESSSPNREYSYSAASDSNIGGDGKKRPFLSSIRARYQKFKEQHGSGSNDQVSPPSSTGTTDSVGAGASPRAPTPGPAPNDVFGVTLQEVMDRQKDSYPTEDLPHVLTTLITKLRENGAKKTEGIFRVPADAGLVQTLRSQLGSGDYNLETKDPHVSAALLKLWLRELQEPLIPPALYDRAIASASDPAQVQEVVRDLDPLRRGVLVYLVAFLRELADKENQAVTRMNDSNLAMVFAPGFLRCTSDNPMVIMTNTTAEKSFVLSLIRLPDLQ